MGEVNTPGESVMSRKKESNKSKKVGRKFPRKLVQEISIEIKT